MTDTAGTSAGTSTGTTADAAAGPGGPPPIPNGPASGPSVAVAPPASAYFMAGGDEPQRLATLAVLVDNQPGVLARVIGLFSGRGYNIESLTVSETEHERHLSRITVVTRGTERVLSQIKAQLGRLVPVHTVVDLTQEALEAGHEKPIERELALAKVVGTGNARLEALRLAESFDARVVDATVGHFVFEITGRSRKIEQFIAILAPLGLVEVARTGVAALNRGDEGLKGRD